MKYFWVAMVESISFLSNSDRNESRIFESLLDVVVAVEPHPGVGGVVELAVEVPELRERELGDHGIAARVHPVGVIREECLLRLPRQDGIREEYTPFISLYTTPLNVISWSGASSS